MATNGLWSLMPTAGADPLWPTAGADPLWPTAGQGATGSGTDIALSASLPRVGWLIRSARPWVGSWPTDPPWPSLPATVTEVNRAAT